MENILSVFIDESGDFGDYGYHSPFYIVTMVYHEQSNNINDGLVYFEKQLKDIGFPNHCIHSGPIIRGEEDYRNIDIKTRKSILRKTAAFVRNLDIRYKNFYIEKKHMENDVEVAGKLSKQISVFLKEHITYF